jgi:hypothetical protein
LIETVGDLRRESLRFKNCIRDCWHGPRFWLDQAQGESVSVIGDTPTANMRLESPEQPQTNQTAFCGSELSPAASG